MSSFFTYDCSIFHWIAFDFPRILLFKNPQGRLPGSVPLFFRKFDFDWQIWNVVTGIKMLKIEIVLHCRLFFFHIVDYGKRVEFFPLSRLQRGNKNFPALVIQSTCLRKWPIFQILQDEFTWSLPYQNCFAWNCMAVTYLFIAWPHKI